MRYDLSMVDLVDLAFWGKEYVLYRFQWLTWLTSHFKKKIEKKICVMSLSMVDFVDFKFWGIK